MKVVLLFPKRYSVAKSAEDTFESMGDDVLSLDYRTILKKYDTALNTQMFRLPFNIRQIWEKYYFGKINDWYINQFEAIKPDIIVIYNNEMLLPSTLKWLKERNTRIIFFLGDNPLYTFTSRYNLAVLDYADLILSPDSFWESQLKKTGLHKIIHFMFSTPNNMYYQIGNDNESYASRSIEVLYVGISYNDSWGYKKAKFLSHFTNSKLQLHGNRTWKKWFEFFPELEKHFIEKESFIKTEKLNHLYNRAKIIPVDGNPGLMHGLHLRVFESLGSGALPLMEWQDDLGFLFEGYNELPAVHSYSEIPELVDYYLKNEDIRSKTVESMKKIYNEKFSPIENGKIIYNSL